MGSEGACPRFLPAAPERFGDAVRAPATPSACAVVAAPFAFLPDWALAPLPPEDGPARLFRTLLLAAAGEGEVAAVVCCASAFGAALKKPRMSCDPCAASASFLPTAEDFPPFPAPAGWGESSPPGWGARSATRAESVSEMVCADPTATPLPSRAGTDAATVLIAATMAVLAAAALAARVGTVRALRRGMACSFSVCKRRVLPARSALSAESSPSSFESSSCAPLAVTAIALRALARTAAAVVVGIVVARPALAAVAVTPPSKCDRSSTGSSFASSRMLASAPLPPRFEEDASSRVARSLPPPLPPVAPASDTRLLSLCPVTLLFFARCSASSCACSCPHSSSSSSAEASSTCCRRAGGERAGGRGSPGRLVDVAAPVARRGGIGSCLRADRSAGTRRVTRRDRTE